MFVVFQGFESVCCISGVWICLLYFRRLNLFVVFQGFEPVCCISGVCICLLYFRGVNLFVVFQGFESVCCISGVWICLLYFRGLNLFVLLTGRLPFPVEPHSNLSQLHAAILRGTTLPLHLSHSEFCISNINKEMFQEQKHITWKNIFTSCKMLSVADLRGGRASGVQIF